MSEINAHDGLIQAEKSKDGNSVLLTLAKKESTDSENNTHKTLSEKKITTDCFEPSYLRDNKLIKRELTGRGTVYFFRWSERLLALRFYYRGGAVAKISKSAFIYNGLKNTRCYQELCVLSYLKQKGVNVPVPVAGLVKRKGLTYRAAIITEVIQDAAELDSLLQKQSIDNEIWESIGQEIRRMHDAQVCHYDLNVKNILLQSSEVHLIDFDKCEIKQGNDWKQANLERLERSLNKQQKLQSQYHYQADNFSALLAGFKAK
jgi:3-deoxy-D-manno-octulosonic acid kinase